MQELLTDIELDMQELKILVKAFGREPNDSLRNVLKRNILQMRGRLDLIFQELDVDQPENEKETLNVNIDTNATMPIVLVEDTNPIINNSSLIADLAPKVDSVSYSPILGESIKTASDLRRSISLNDSFRFARDLFGGDNESMDNVLRQISEMASLNAALILLQSKVSVREDDETMSDFMELLKKFFN